MNAPSWWGALLLFTAAWRTFHLLAHDDILDRPRRYITRAGNAKQDAKGGWISIPKNYREKLAEFIECVYCFGAWCAIAWWGAWLIWPHGTLVVAVPFLLSTGAIAAHKFLSSD